MGWQLPEKYKQVQKQAPVFNNKNKVEKAMRTLTGNQLALHPVNKFPYLINVYEYLKAGYKD